MRVFLAGATGAIGKRLVPLLVAGGHEVIGTTRSPWKIARLESTGAKAVMVDALNRDEIVRAVAAAQPDVIVHELTKIYGNPDFRNFDESFAATNRLRTAGTDNLLDAAQRARVHRFVAQSFAGWPYAREGGPVKSEDDPLDPHPPKGFTETLAAIRHVESRVLGAGGVVLRYGMLYGPPDVVGNSIEQMIAEVRRRRLPIVGGGTGVWSFVHVDDAASATAAAIERGEPGLYNIVDDEPAPAAEIFTELARIAGAKPPMRLPRWIGRLLLGAGGVSFMTEIRGASNRKAKEQLGWTPRWKTWREGFAALLR